MNESQIDEAIFVELADANGRWRKVARVVGRAANNLGETLPQGPEGEHAVAKRIAQLVEQGRLLSKGDISQWMYSEIKLS